MKKVSPKVRYYFTKKHFESSNFITNLEKFLKRNYERASIPKNYQ